MYLTNDPTPRLPHFAMYRRSELCWNDNGTKYFVPYMHKVEVIDKTEKSYKIKYATSGRESWVRRNKIKFIYLIDKDYCELRGRRIPPLGCRMCYEKCAYRMTDMPSSY